MADDETVAHTVVRKPLASIESELRKRFGISGQIVDVAVEKEALVFTFLNGKRSNSEGSATQDGPSTGPDVTSADRPVRIRRRAKRRVRNRMRTRGWKVVDRVVNSHGQICSIYKPILDALREKGARRREAYTAVRQLLIANGNDPGPSSIEYYLDNHLEYLKRPNTSGSVTG